ncbi:alanine racemase [Bordetella sp. LUAb4]|uniref:alanine racemase n=1 Tax=Bordetella sp. LUAb4 TaxID=2843195 RepID=UPI001E58E560|nr:alanine racemase [Bordetella sp. LUAb4]
MAELPALREFRPGQADAAACLLTQGTEASTRGHAAGLHRVYARVDAAAVAYNVTRLRGLMLAAGSAPRIWATVKADAYGHGVARVLAGLAGADGLAVAQLADAHACRDAGWQGPVLVYGGLQDTDDVRDLSLPGLHLVISHAAQLDRLEHENAFAAQCSLWLRYAGDLGMNGFDEIAYLDAYRRGMALIERGRVATVGHFQHYGQGEDPASVARADARFEALTSGLSGPRSAGNSASILHPAAARIGADWVRPGLALYGASPLAGIVGAGLGLRPAMSLHSRLCSVRNVAAGARLGYGGAFVAPRAMRIGLVACGYGDGYPRHAPAGTPVNVGGVRVGTLGVVTMDSLLVDLSDAPDAEIGTPVTLWGSEDLPVEAVARHIGTIAAALLTSLTPRVAFVEAY